MQSIHTTTTEELEEIRLLSTLHRYQQDGHLCDVMMVSSQCKKFVAHAAVLAAASSVLEAELSHCDRGNYLIKIPLTSTETEALIRYAYTGQFGISQLDSIEKLAHFCDRGDFEPHEGLIISGLEDFARRGLFCNMAWYNMEGEIQPCHSFLIAAKYEFMSQHIFTGSIVHVTESDGTCADTSTMTAISETPTVALPGECVCTSCGETFVSTSSLVPSLTAGEVAYRDTCLLCQSSLTLSPEEGEFPCIICHKVFKLKREFEQHKRMHDDVQFRCLTCNKCYANKNSLRVHERLHTDDMLFECDICQKAFKTKGNLKKHEHSHTDSKPYECETCQTHFKTKCGLSRHNNSHAGYKPQVCDRCGKCFGTTNELKTHKVIHTDDKPFMCDTCDKGFKLRTALKSHQLTHATHKPFPCDKCDKNFASFTKLNMHKIVHIQEKSFPCETCQKCFKTKNKLREHERIHTTDKPYKCDQCHKSFKGRRDLSQHLLVHIDDKDYTCPICQKCVKTMGSIKRHMLTHVEDYKPFECTECDKSFKDNTTLKRHIATHTGERLYTVACATCKKLFRTIWELTRHQQRMHTDDWPYDLGAHQTSTTHAYWWSTLTAIVVVKFKF